jgi:hypothetical protein
MLGTHHKSPTPSTLLRPCFEPRFEPNSLKNNSVEQFSVPITLVRVPELGVPTRFGLGWRRWPGGSYSFSQHGIPSVAGRGDVPELGGLTAASDLEGIQPPRRMAGQFVRLATGTSDCPPGPERLAVQGTRAHRSGINSAARSDGLPEKDGQETPKPLESQGFSIFCLPVSASDNKRGRRDSNPQPLDRQSSTLTN